jgi:hypothetical protein
MWHKPEAPEGESSIEGIKNPRTKSYLHIEYSYEIISPGQFQPTEIISTPVEFNGRACIPEMEGDSDPSVINKKKDYNRIEK